jgi:hypothetical protein
VPGNSRGQLNLLWEIARIEYLPRTDLLRFTRRYSTPGSGKPGAVGWREAIWIISHKSHWPFVGLTAGHQSFNVQQQNADSKMDLLRELLQMMCALDKNRQTTQERTTSWTTSSML